MKDILKEIKLNESLISMFLGAVVVLILGTLLVSYYRNNDGLFLRGHSSNEQESGTEEDVNVMAGQKYTVVAGDSLWNIAEREYGTGYEWQEIKAANPTIASADDIEVGQEIIIPDTNKILEEAAATSAEEEKGTTTTPVAHAETATESTHPETQTPHPGGTYAVQRGESLWDIAVVVYGDGYRWTDIAEANNLVNPNIIHVGNNLTLPA